MSEPMNSDVTADLPNKDDTPAHLTGNFAPVMEECTSFDLPVEGQIPPNLRGSYVRNGPNPCLLYTSDAADE